MKNFSTLILYLFLSLDSFAIYNPVGSVISGDHPYVVSGFPDGRNEWFGHTVAMNSDGTIVASGAYKNSRINSASGAVRVFKNDQGEWSMMGQELTGYDVGEAFGSSVSLNSDGTVLSVGCYNATPSGSLSSQIGNVKIFKFDSSSNSWNQLGSDINGNGGHKDWSGWATALNGDGSIVAIGAYNSSINGSSSGYVKVYELINGDWEQLGNTIVGGASFYRIGETLDIDDSGKILAIGSRVLNSVAIYELEGSFWVLRNESFSEGHNFDLSSDGKFVAIANSEHDLPHYSSFNVYKYENGEYNQLGNTEYSNLYQNMGYDGVQITDDGLRVFIAGSAGMPNLEHGQIAVYDLVNSLWEKKTTINYGSILIGNYHSYNEIAISNDGTSIVIGDRTVNNMTGEIKVFYSFVDTDGDGVEDYRDAFPSDPLETTDTDGDGIGNNTDLDDDGDLLLDAKEFEFGTDPLSTDDYNSLLSIINETDYSIMNGINPLVHEEVVAERDAAIEERDIAIAERDARPTRESYDALQAESASKHSLEEIRDLRPGSKMIQVLDNMVNISMIIEESDDLDSWNEGSTMSIEIPIEEGSNKKFYRFKMDDYTNSVFSIIEGGYTWHEAKVDAESRGGRLAVLSTEMSEIRASNVINQFDGPLWIGLTDEETEGVYKWVNGESLSYSNWWNGFPSNSQLENHVHINWVNRDDAIWYNGPYQKDQRRWNDAPFNDPNVGPIDPDYQVHHSYSRGYLLEVPAP